MIASHRKPEDYLEAIRKQLESDFQRVNVDYLLDEANRAFRVNIKCFAQGKNYNLSFSEDYLSMKFELKEAEEYMHYVYNDLRRWISSSRKEAGLDEITGNNLKKIDTKPWYEKFDPSSFKEEYSPAYTPMKMEKTGIVNREQEDINKRKALKDYGAY